MHESSSPIECQVKVRQEVMRVTVGSGETRLLGKACKCFPRNPGKVNDLNGVASLISVWHKSFIPWLLNVESKSLVNACASLQLNH